MSLRDGVCLPRPGCEPAAVARNERCKFQGLRFRFLQLSPPYCSTPPVLSWQTCTGLYKHETHECRVLTVDAEGLVDCEEAEVRQHGGDRFVGDSKSAASKMQLVPTLKEHFLK